MPRRHHLHAALARAGFRRLLGVRLASQFGDGVLQASLAGAVLFNPERSASAADVAAGFAVLLLPYSLIGPFAGVLLDRWSRQRTMVLANIVRAVAVLGLGAEIAGGVGGVGFYASALVLISLGRFLLAALSAALPRVVDPAELVTANAVSTTCGTLIAAAGGGAAIGVRALIGSGNAAYAAVAAASALPYLLAALVALPFATSALGPSEDERRDRDTVRGIAVGLLAGAKHVRDRRPVRDGLTMIGVHRLCYGVTTVCTLLLYRNYFHADGFFRAGLAGLSQVVAAIAVGGGLAALVTPAAFRRLGAIGWPVVLLVAAAVVQIVLGLPFRLSLLPPAALVLAFVAQAIKITVDTLVQQYVDDEFRGRVFSIYDAVFNVTLVIAAVLTATVLPADGHSPATVVVVAVCYLAVAALYAWVGGRDRVTAAARTTASVR
ncbi:MFS transporter [Jatrophihabitans endophyticus]|uniref:MFS transporter n=1 Tax=Jatrophihabitans endophyticus TaxID=1206085 RepID=UPI0019F47BA9|nr:MFS transporter [Jatrophihabitans endophyticus]MBE7187452.1 MFS transporter [Jatrophihabitans endophyticus]